MHDPGAQGQRAVQGPRSAQPRAARRGGSRPRHARAARRGVALFEAYAACPPSRCRRSGRPRQGARCHTGAGHRIYCRERRHWCKMQSHLNSTRTAGPDPGAQGQRAVQGPRSAQPRAARRGWSRPRHAARRGVALFEANAASPRASVSPLRPAETPVSRRRRGGAAGQDIGYIVASASIGVKCSHFTRTHAVGHRREAGVRLPRAGGA